MLVTYWKFIGLGLKVKPLPVPTFRVTVTFCETPPALMVSVAVLGPVGKPAEFAFNWMTCDPVSGPEAGLTVSQT